MARAFVAGLFRGLVLALATPVAAIAQPPATTLSDGVVLQRPLATGQSHAYALDLRPGQYVQVTIEQQGVDVSQTVTGPDGTTVVAADTPGAEYGPDALAFVAPAGGRFLLTVRVAGRAGKMAAEPAYELRVEAVREPTERDLRRVAIVRKNAELARMNPERDTRRALDLFLECIRDWHELGETRLRMWAENYAGYMLGEFMDRHDEGLAYYRRALASAREAGDAFAEAYVLHNIGVVLTRQGLFDEARSSLEEGLRLHAQAGRRFREALALTALGGLANNAGDPQQALDHLLESLRLYAELGETRNAAVARLNIGPTYVRLGEPEAALEHYRLALPALGNEQRLRARVITQMAVAHSALGDRPAARAALEDALGLYRTLENRALEASTSTTLAVLEREEGSLDSALKRLEEAVRVLRASGFRMMEARSLCELGETRRLLGDHGGAREALEAVLALVSEPASPEVLCAQAGLARTARDRGDLPAARSRVERALATVETTRGSLASLRSRASALAGQQSLYDLAVQVRMLQHEAEPAAGHDVAALEIAERARARSLLRLLAESGSDIREGVDPDLLAEERSVIARLNGAAEAQDQALAARKADRAENLGRELTLLTTRLAELEARIRRVSPR
jgi:tetratricopeptide (TPR) repeat protein